jgi:Protein of unknown function (DUF2892).
MRVNLGSLDRITRVAAGSVLLVLGWMLGGWSLVVALLGVALIITGAAGYCPVYARLGISTSPRR